MKRQVSEKIEKISNGILAMAGVFSSAKPGARPAGSSKTGASVFTSDGLAQSTDTRSGAALVHTMAAFITPFNVLSDAEKKGAFKLGDLSGNPKLLAALDKAHLDRNGETFAATLIKAIGKETSHALAVVTALKMYDHWGVMSPAQKSLAIAAMGIQLHKTDKGGAICDLVIISGPGQKFTVKDAIDMLQAGKNPYPLVQNWNQIYKLLKVYNDAPSNEAMADFAASHNFLGLGPNDAAAPGVTRKFIDSAGARPAPQYGVGALVSPGGKAPPDNYQAVAGDKSQAIIVPKANVNTAQGALQGSLVGTKGGSDGISSDSVATYKKWNKADAKAKDKGSEGGSAFIAGLNQLKRTSPYLYSALVSFLACYAHRSIDSANPSKYVASLAGIALARIVAGKSEEKADKEGVAVAGTVHDSTAADFAKLQIQMRALYANFGVSSKADAYQLSNQAYSEGRIDESSLVAVHEIYDLIYDTDSFGRIPKLIQAKDKGLEVVKSHVDAHNSMSEGRTEEYKENDVRARNAKRYAKPEAQVSSGV